ncbi:DUF1777-domain-containing protein [Viridothelium virens]|uniref:DUF1777-domain-containing protein n=1 Tax=Viridothelium virens TaxID=1048519 RepID=A0A6A6H5A7_VIRVR|nr:DUF1777-domain-containing protein [Viridothelium virens]
MTEPPAKRARRTDSMAMWEQNENSPQPDAARQPLSRKDGPKPDNHDRRNRSRSRERREARRERSDDKPREPKHSSDRKPRRDRDRDRDRDRKPRERSRSREKQRSRRDDRQRSRSPHRESSQKSPPRGPRAYRTRSRERHSGAPPNGVDRSRPNHTAASSRTQDQAEKTMPNGGKDSMDIDGVAGEIAEDDEEAQMRAMMGFGAFKTTKNKKVPGNDKLFGVRKEKKAKYRQYMNRVGGFNRPLSPSAE